MVGSEQTVGSGNRKKSSRKTACLCDKQGYLLLFINHRRCTDTWLCFEFINLLLRASGMKQFVNLVTLINQKDRAKMLNTLFKTKLQAVPIQFVALVKSNFLYSLFPGNFQSNCSFHLLVVAVSERLHIKTYFSKTRKACKNQKFLVLYRMVALKKSKRLKEYDYHGNLLLPQDFTKTRQYYGHFPKNVPTFLEQQLFHKTGLNDSFYGIFICLV